MAYVLGIDIGTSFTAAAIASLDGDQDRDRRTAAEPLNLGRRGGAVPSVVFLGEDGSVQVGETAERRGLDQPHRVVREFKRRVGDSVPIVVGDLCVSAEDIFAIVARWVVDRAEEREGTPPDAIMVSHPASWGDYKTGQVRAALAGVGLADVDLVSEPEAAALHYAAGERVDAGSTIAVYDLGGGTFDVAILTKDDSESFRPLGRPAGIERLGGADFDEAVFGHVAASLGSALGDLDPADPGALVALSRVRRECTEAKEALSFDSEATIPVLLPGVQTHVRLVRSEFESMIERSVRDSIESLAQAIQAAGVQVEDLTAVLLIGGSSRIPLVAQMLSGELNRPIAIDADPKASISLGAAFAAAAARVSTTLPEPQTEAVTETAVGGAAGQDDVPETAHGAHFGAGAPFAPSSSGATRATPAGVALRLAGVSAVVAALIVLAGTAPHTASDASLLASQSGAQAEERAGGTPPEQPAGQQPAAGSDTSPNADASPFSSSDPGGPDQVLAPSTPPSQRPNAEPTPDPGQTTSPTTPAVPPVDPQPTTPPGTPVPTEPPSTPTPTTPPTEPPVTTPTPTAPPTEPPPTTAPPTPEPPSTDPPTPDPPSNGPSAPPTTSPPTEPAPAAAAPPVVSMEL